MALSPDGVGAGADDAEQPEPASGFSVSLSNFDGPFDLLLSLIAKHELDITEVSLSKITDEFISYLRGLDSAAELDQASEFLVVAATLLDLKVAGLLPQGELVDAEDVALLEARDLLFARLLQYRAFKEAAQWFSGQLDAESTRHYPVGAARGEVPQADARAGLDAHARRLRGARRARVRAARDPDRRARPSARAAGQHPGAGGPRRRSAAVGRAR